MEQWQVELFERMARMEANQEFLKEKVTKIPQSEQCAADIAELRQKVTELEKFKTAIKEKIAYIGGVIVVIGLFVPTAIKWVLDHLSWKL